MTIGITFTGVGEKQHNYVDWIKQNDPEITIVTLSAEPKENKGQFSDCDALILSGGIDVHPGYYNSDNFVYPGMPGQFYEKRDAFEKKLFEQALGRQLPVLGICRGMQLINVLLGGTMHQDLAAKNTVHKSITDKQDNQFDKVHGVHIVPGTVLEGICGTLRAAVNSAHHQAADQVADELMVNCRSDDQVIEGLEWKDKTRKPFLLAAQWHPERMYEFNLEELAITRALRSAFLEAVRQSKITA